MERQKERIAHYWGQRSEGFRQAHQGEWDSPTASVYREVISSHLSKPGAAILDVGTGSGFFPLLLKDLDAQITGIDLTPEMLEQARDAVKEQGASARFLQMDAEHLAFDGESFDLILTRNLTWNLPRLGQAYREWFRVLKPGGVLLNFDGDYVEADRKKSPQELDKFHASQPITQAMQAEYREILEDLAGGHHPRPQWDEQLLREAGFSKVEVDMSFGRRLGQRPEDTPLFCITAYKGR